MKNISMIIAGLVISASAFANPTETPVPATNVTPVAVQETATPTAKEEVTEQKAPVAKPKRKEQGQTLRPSMLPAAKAIESDPIGK